VVEVVRHVEDGTIGDHVGLLGKKELC